MFHLQSRILQNLKEIVMLEFKFFLDAWKYCRDHDIPLTKIRRQNWETWVVITHDVAQEIGA